MAHRSSTRLALTKRIAGIRQLVLAFATPAALPAIRSAAQTVRAKQVASNAVVGPFTAFPLQATKAAVPSLRNAVVARRTSAIAKLMTVLGPVRLAPVVVLLARPLLLPAVLLRAGVLRPIGHGALIAAAVGPRLTPSTASPT